MAAGGRPPGSRRLVVVHKNKCRERLGQIERRWQARPGGQAVRRLREALRRLTGGPGPAQLSAGLEPLPGGWRAAVRGPVTLPQYPLVLHRGGFPGGSYEAERAQQAVLLQDLFGNVLRGAAVDPYCLGWADGTVVKTEKE